LPSTIPKQKPKKGFVPRNSEKFDVPLDTHEPLQEIDSGNIGEMVDSSSEDLVNELNAKIKKFRLWPLAATVGLVATGFIAYKGFPSWAIYTSIVVFIILTVIARYRDTMSKTIVILYDIEDQFQVTYEMLHKSFEAMKNCIARWHLEAEGRVKKKKYHAGADSLVRVAHFIITSKPTLCENKYRHTQHSCWETKTLFFSR
jgi:hypothetical protein